MSFQWTLRNGQEATCVFNRRLNNLHEPNGLEPYALQRAAATFPF
jgi:type IV secretion system protein VirB9